MNKDSYLILEALPADFDSRVKAMEARPPPRAGPTPDPQPPIARVLPSSLVTIEYIAKVVVSCPGLMGPLD